MTDTVFAALIGVGGAVLVALVSIITQLRITKVVITAERDRIYQRIQEEELSRLREKRTDSIRIAISEMLATADPQSKRGVDYTRTVNLVSQVQLLLNYRQPSEGALNDSLNKLCIALQEYVAVETLPIDQKMAEMTNVLRWHSAVLERTKAVIVASSTSPI